jgi:hypothetical protein
MAGDGRLTRVDGEWPVTFTEPATREQLLRSLGELASWVDLSNSEAADRPEISDEMSERLRALGYQH